MTNSPKFPLMKFVPALQEVSPPDHTMEQVQPHPSTFQIIPPVDELKYKRLYGNGARIYFNMVECCAHVLCDRQTEWKEPICHALVPPRDTIVHRPDMQVPFSLPHIMIVCGAVNLVALVDSGCEVTCMNEEHFNHLQQTLSFPLLPVSSTHLRGAMGQRSCRVRFQGWIQFHILGQNLSFQHAFLSVKNLVRPVILGVDWLSMVNAEVNFPQRSISIQQDNTVSQVPFYDFDGSAVSPVSASYGNVAAVTHSPSPLLITFHNLYPKLLAEGVANDSMISQKLEELNGVGASERVLFGNLLTNFRFLFNLYPGRTHKYQHVIKLHDSTPFVKRPYPIPFSLRAEVNKTIKNMLELGVIKRESSPYASPMTVVRKKDGSVRVCLDARMLNSRMIADHEAPTPPEEIFNSLSTVRYLSTIDLRASYWQIPLSPGSAFWPQNCGCFFYSRHGRYFGTGNSTVHFPLR
uniref:Reverse transcriptase domain-containing protein n=1 Tax=Photinus pyralis TaxID=7054 RepID=A0A1Y1NCN6_PHOPY